MDHDLVREHMPLARSLALRYRGRGEPVDDLVQVAYLGLVKAVDGYVPGRGPAFTAYAVPTITGELRRHFRDHGWDVRPPRRLQELRARARSTAAALEQQLGRAPSESELADALGVAPQELAEMRSASEGYDTDSLDRPPGTDSPTLDHDRRQRDDGTDQELEELLRSQSVIPLLEQLPEREMLVLALRYYGGWTQQAIGERIGVTQMQVSRIISQCLSRLRSQLEVQPEVGGPARTGARRAGQATARCQARSTCSRTRPAA
jgi:RNA polymerase sigma-B factor